MCLQSSSLVLTYVANISIGWLQYVPKNDLALTRVINGDYSVCCANVY